MTNNTVNKHTCKGRRYNLGFCEACKQDKRDTADIFKVTGRCPETGKKLKDT